MTFYEKHALLSKYFEGTEIGDAVERLLDAAWSLKGINYDAEATTVLDIAEVLIKNDLDYIIIESGDYESYKQFDDEVYKYVTGKPKLSKEKFESSETQVNEFFK